MLPVATPGFVDQSAVRWVLFSRALLGTLFLLGALALEWTNSVHLVPFTTTPIYVYAILTYGSSLLLAFIAVYVARWAHFAFTYVLTGFDLLLVSALVLYTGASASPFIFLYLLGIVGTAILSLRRIAIIAAALSMVCLGLILLAEWYDNVPMTFMRTVHRATSSELLVTAFYNITAFYLVGILGSYLGGRLRLAGEELDRRDVDISILKGLQERIVDNVASGLITVDPKGRILLLNRQAELILGLPASRLWGTSLHNVFEGLVLGASNEELRQEVTYLHPDGKPRSLGYSISTIRIDARHDGFILVFQDLTRMKELEAVVMRQAKLAAVGTMAAGLAHEIRNPLGSISGCLQLLRQHESQLDDEARDLLTIALREIDSLNALIHDFLLYARPFRHETKRVSPAEVFAEVIETLCLDPNTPEGMVFENTLDAALEIDADPNTLRQIFLNLATNAVQAGAGRIVARSVPAGNDGAVQVEIVDDGAGFSSDAMGRLFEPFHTTRVGGVGLGLAIVYRVMEEYAGSVGVRSQPGDTVITLRFPVAKAVV